MEPGEIWWAQFDEKRLVVLLSGDAGSEFLAMQIVEPATSAQKPCRRTQGPRQSTERRSRAGFFVEPGQHALVPLLCRLGRS